MKYNASVDGQAIEVEIEGQGEELSIVVSGEKLSASVTQVTSPSLYSIILGGDSHELIVEKRDGAYVISIGGQVIPVRVKGRHSRRLSGSSVTAGTTNGEIAVRAPMPGLVVSVQVRPGTAVAEDSALLVLEAMKMLNEVRAPRSGLVKSVEVHQGDTVEGGQVLIRLEESA